MGQWLAAESEKLQQAINEYLVMKQVISNVQLALLLLLGANKEGKNDLKDRQRSSVLLKPEDAPTIALVSGLHKLQRHSNKGVIPCVIL